MKDLGSIIFRLASFEAILVVIADTRRVQLASTNLLSFSRDYILPLDIEPRIHREERERERGREKERLETGTGVDEKNEKRLDDPLVSVSKRKKKKKKRRNSGLWYRTTDLMLVPPFRLISNLCLRRKRGRRYYILVYYRIALVETVDYRYVDDQCSYIFVRPRRG